MVIGIVVNVMEDEHRKEMEAEGEPTINDVMRELQLLRQQVEQNNQSVRTDEAKDKANN